MSSTKNPGPTSGIRRAPKRGRGRPLKYAVPVARLVVYVPPPLLDGLRRFAAHEEAEGRKRPTPSDIAMRAFGAYRPLARFLAAKRVAIFRAEK